MYEYMCVCVGVCVGQSRWIWIPRYSPVSNPIGVSLKSFSLRNLFAEIYSRSSFLSAFVSLFYLPCGVVRPRQLICRLYPTLTPVSIKLRSISQTLGKIKSNYCKSPHVCF